MANYYSETRYYYRRGYGYPYIEDKEIRTEKHPISEKAYNFFIEEVYAGKSPLTNSDGSFSFWTVINSLQGTEVTFWKE